jgi:hypothetical protein
LIHDLATVGDDGIEGVPFEIEVQLALFPDGVGTYLAGYLLR